MRDASGEQPKTRGAVEPCDRKIKNKLAHKLASAGGAAKMSAQGVAKFGGLRRLLKAVDAFVFEHLKPRVRKLAHVVERSDAMLAVYPGQGTRFQRHIDNTAGDGRVLTVLVYLNEQWKQDDGGALRVFPANGRTPGAGAAPGEGARGVVDVMPECGRMAMFFADEVPHEVRPTRSYSSSHMAATVVI